MRRTKRTDHSPSSTAGLRILGMAYVKKGVMFELDKRLKFDSNLLRLLNKWNKTVLKAEN